MHKILNIEQNIYLKISTLHIGNMSAVYVVELGLTSNIELVPVGFSEWKICRQEECELPGAKQSKVLK